jgi:hypothetical protein
LFSRLRFCNILQFDLDRIPLVPFGLGHPLSLLPGSSWLTDSGFFRLPGYRLTCGICSVSIGDHPVLGNPLNVSQRLL